MTREKVVKGTIYGLISLILVSFEPIVAAAKPDEIDAYLFATTTCVIEALIFGPLMGIERRKMKSFQINNPSSKEVIFSRLNSWKKRKNLFFMVYIGINFAIAQILFFLAIQLGGAINIALAQQMSLIFALLFGFLINHEKITIVQIAFSFILIFGLTLAITQGSLNVLELNVGVAIMIFTTILWTVAHAKTKNIFKREEFTPTQFVFIRNLLSGSILISTYFLFFPLENIKLFFNPLNQFYFITMGFLYGFDVFFWYKTLENLDFSKAEVIVTPMPLLTALFATIILGETFTIFHLIGALIIISSIIMIVRQKKE